VTTAPLETAVEEGHASAPVRTCRSCGEGGLRVFLELG
jgi:hypothetical protein